MVAPSLRGSTPIALVDALPRDAIGEVRRLADLLATMIRLADRDAPPLDDMVETAIVGDGFLARAARAGLTLADIELAFIRATLHVVGGNKSRAARRLGINRRTLQRRLDGDTREDADDDG